MNWSKLPVLKQNAEGKAAQLQGHLANAMEVDSLLLGQWRCSVCSGEHIPAKVVPSVHCLLGGNGATEGAWFGIPSVPHWGSSLAHTFTDSHSITKPSSSIPHLYTQRTTARNSCNSLHFVGDLSGHSVTGPRPHGYCVLRGTPEARIPDSYH